MLRPYLDSDFEQVQNWGKAWGATYSRDLFPPAGLIVPGVCAFFLYETPSKVCFLENLISNKYADAALVESSVDLIMGEMFKLAKEKGYEIAYASTNIGSVVTRAMKVGCVISPNYVLLQKKL